MKRISLNDEWQIRRALKATSTLPLPVWMKSKDPASAQEQLAAERDSLRRARTRLMVLLAWRGALTAKEVLSLNFEQFTAWHAGCQFPPPLVLQPQQADRKLQLEAGEIRFPANGESQELLSAFRDYARVLERNGLLGRSQALLVNKHGSRISRKTVGSDWRWALERAALREAQLNDEDEQPVWLDYGFDDLRYDAMCECGGTPQSIAAFARCSLEVAERHTKSASKDSEVFNPGLYDEARQTQTPSEDLIAFSPIARRYAALAPDAATLELLRRGLRAWSQEVVLSHVGSVGDDGWHRMLDACKDAKVERIAVFEVFDLGTSDQEILETARHLRERGTPLYSSGHLFWPTPENAKKVSRFFKLLDKLRELSIELDRAAVARARRQESAQQAPHVGRPRKRPPEKVMPLLESESPSAAEVAERGEVSLPTARAWIRAARRGD